MNQDKMHLVNKIFNNETIRTVWDKEQEKYFISVVDIVGVISESNNPQTYWRVLKKWLKDEGNETVTNCNALKLKTVDGERIDETFDPSLATQRSIDLYRAKGFDELEKVVKWRK